MKLFGIWDCNCEGRKAESGIDNPFVYWLLWKPAQLLRGLLWRAVGAVYGFGDHLTTMEGHLTATIRRANGLIEELDLGRNTITDAAVAYLVDDFDNGITEISDMKYHTWGTGACATPPTCPTAAVVTEGSESRVVGTQSQPTAPQFRSVATITADGTKTIKEWALMSATTAGTAWSLRCFTGIALVLNDSIEFTYTLTINCVTG